MRREALAPKAFEAGQIFLRESVGNWLGDELSVPKGVVGFLPRNGYILYAQRDHLLRPISVGKVQTVQSRRLDQPGRTLWPLRLKARSHDPYRSESLPRSFRYAMRRSG
jgi:hypothetical protein